MTTGTLAGRTLAARLEQAPLLLLAALSAACACIGLIAGVEPALAIGLALAAAFALVAFVDLAAGLAAYTPLAFLWPGALGKPLIAATIVLVLSWLARVATGRSAARGALLNERGVLGIAALLLAWVALSATWAQDSGSAFTEVSRFLMGITLFLLVCAAVEDRRSAVVVLAGYVVGATAAAIYSFAVPPDADAQDAVARTTIDPNELAAVLLPATALAIGGLTAPHRLPLLRLGAGIAFGLCVASFLLTGSRGGVVAFAVLLVAAILVAGRWRAVTALAAIAAAAFSLFFFAALAPEDIRERVLEPSRGEVRVEESRFTLWDVGWRMVEDKPLTGVGVGNFGEEAVNYLFEPGHLFRTDVVINQNQPAHNTYLHLFGELGAVGGLIFLALAALSIWSSGAAARAFARANDQAMEIVARALLAGQLAMLTAIFFFSAQSVNELWLVLAFGPALLAVSRRASHRPT
jgi:O-antigen ligase